MNKYQLLKLLKLLFVLVVFMVLWAGHTYGKSRYLMISGELPSILNKTVYLKKLKFEDVEYIHGQTEIWNKWKVKILNNTFNDVGDDEVHRYGREFLNGLIIRKDPDRYVVVEYVGAKLREILKFNEDILHPLVVAVESNDLRMALILKHYSSGHGKRKRLDDMGVALFYCNEKLVDEFLRENYGYDEILWNEMDFSLYRFSRIVCPGMSGVVAEKLKLKLDIMDYVYR